jgi:putative transposase
VFRSLTYPLLPTKAQAAILTNYLGDCCDLYNGALQERRDAWRKAGASIGYVNQCRSLTEIRATLPTWKVVPTEISRSALKRLDRAFDAFFRRCALGEAPGYPRFRKRKRYDSFDFPPDTPAHWPLRGHHVKIPGIGLVRLNLYRPLPDGAVVKEVNVRRDATERWWVTFKCDIGAAPAKIDPATIAPARMVGVDVGLHTLAMLSTGDAIANPRHGRTSAETLARRQRAMARKKPGSAGKRKARILVAKTHAHIHNQRKDTAYKAAASLARRFDLICFEALVVAAMVHGNLAASIHDAGWRLLMTATACKAEGAGKHVVMVDPRGTTQECSGCGATVPKGLGVRVHRCPACGLVCDRDVNAARNILARGRRAVSLPGACDLPGPEGHTLASRRKAKAARRGATYTIACRSRTPSPPY